MQFFLVALTGLAVLIGAAVFSRRTGIAAPLLLLVVGIAASLIPTIPNLALEPEWILSGVLPPLLYASSVQMPVVDLRRNARMIIWLSIVMVIVGAVVVGGTVHLLFPQIPLPLAIALGAVVNPTDAVAATSIGKRLGLPHRLMTVLEGESLFNDAAALVTLRTAVAALATSFSFWQAAGNLLWASVGGALVGWATGWLNTAIRSRLGDPVLTTTISFAVPWVAYFCGEELHASGVIAVVVAGITSGHNARLGLSAVERATEATTWATVNFVLENAVFLVMGMQIGLLLEDSRADGGAGMVLPLSLLILGLLVVLRMLSVAIPLLWQRLRPDSTTRLRERLSTYAERLREAEEQEQIDADRAQALHRRLDQGRADVEFLEKQPITRRGGLVLAWSGMRGVVTLAAAQTIPQLAAGQPTPYRSTVILTAFVVAVTTLVVFGGTLPWVIRRVNFRAPSQSDRRQEFTDLLRSLSDAVRDQLGPLAQQQVNGHAISPAAAEMVSKRFAPMLMGRSHPPTVGQADVRAQAITIQQRYLTEFRQALAREQLVGAYSPEVLTQAQRLLDAEERRLDWAGS